MSLGSLRRPGHWRVLDRGIIAPSVESPHAGLWVMCYAQRYGTGDANQRLNSGRDA